MMSSCSACRVAAACAAKRERSERRLDEAACRADRRGRQEQRALWTPPDDAEVSEGAGTHDHHKRIGRLMRSMICAAASVDHFACARGFRHTTRCPECPGAETSLRRAGQKWLADMTYVPTAEGATWRSS